MIGYALRTLPPPLARSDWVNALVCVKADGEDLIMPGVMSCTVSVLRGRGGEAGRLHRGDCMVDYLMFDLSPY